MTVILAQKYNGKIYMCSDREGIHSDIIFYAKEPKVFIKSNILFGITGSYREAQILQTFLKISTPRGVESDIEYLRKTLVPGIMQALKDNECMMYQDGVSSMYSEILIGFNGKIYGIYSDFQCSEINLPYYAMGIGRQLALGAMELGSFATSSFKDEDADRVVTLFLFKVLSAVSKFCPEINSNISDVLSI